MSNAQATKTAVKTFETHWSETQVALSNYESWRPVSFARGFVGHDGRMYLPDNISYLDLSKFCGRKTRVTIEVIE